MAAYKSIHTALSAGLFAAILTAPAPAQSVQLLGDFREWSAYSTSQGASKLCFVMSKPTAVEPQPDGFSEAYLYLTHRPSENIANEINIVAGFDFETDSEATLTIGSNSYTLFTTQDAAWLADPSLSGTVAGNMRAGSALTVEGSDKSGVRVRQTFSLSGVTAASRAIDQECS